MLIFQGASWRWRSFTVGSCLSFLCSNWNFAPKKSWLTPSQNIHMKKTTDKTMETTPRIAESQNEILRGPPWHDKYFSFFCFRDETSLFFCGGGGRELNSVGSWKPSPSQQKQGPLGYTCGWDPKLNLHFPLTSEQRTAGVLASRRLILGMLGGGNSNIFYVHPYLGKIPILTNIFQRGWFNHQLEYDFPSLGLWYNFTGVNTWIFYY